MTTQIIEVSKEMKIAMICTKINLPSLNQPETLHLEYIVLDVKI